MRAKPKPSKVTKTRPARKVPGRPVKDMAGSVESVARAVDAIRRGSPVWIRGDGDILMLAVETASDAALANLPNRTAARLLLTHARARTLKIRLYTPEIIALPIAKDASVQDLRAIADPTADLNFPMKGPFEALREKLPASYAAAVKLAKLAGLLPAAIVIAAPKKPKDAREIAAADILSYDSEIIRTLTLVSRARVPLEGAEQTELAAFRPKDGGPEHYAIIIGAPATPGPVLTRLHSECFTGDLLGSLKCDCGNQLRGAIETISKAGGGILLYLAQEGRGIGLINKLRAYRLQDQGFDTIQANERLGFEADERLYGIAAKMLTMLGYRKVRLLTNNPDKVAALAAAGIEVVERVRHAFPDNDHNRAYLKTKAEKAGHLL
jgi:GTP cyclohydrolase II